MTIDAGELGAFLKARRDRLDPTDLGLPRGRRRTPGLRREEVAARAGLSVDYLARLEQGRAERPSPEVLDALARALRLDPDAHRHLRLLAGVAPPPARSAPSKVRPELVAAVEALAPAAAYLVTRTMDVVTATPAARAILGMVGRHEQPNIVRALFLEPDARRCFVSWETVAADAVAHLRVAADAPDPALDELVAELTAASPEFTALWARHDVAPCSSGFKHHDHHAVGPFTTAFESFPAWDGSGALVVFRPAGDERSRTAYELLTRVALDPA